MKESTRAALRSFSQISTWHTTHWADDERFMDFIIEAYRNNDFSIDTDSFREEFGEIGKHLEEKFFELYIQYEQGIALLRRINA